MRIPGPCRHRRAVDELASAYQSFYASNGSKAAKARVSAARAEVNSFCPGAAP
ncbi:MAG: hypothetical protein ABR972_00500 [Acidimicrobiales bacterium]|jgi:hypothetical protein